MAFIDDDQVKELRRKVRVVGNLNRAAGLDLAPG
jgi:hypothetical protein